MERNNDLSRYIDVRGENILRTAVGSTFRQSGGTRVLQRYLQAGQIAQKKRDRLEDEGIHVPSVLIASITNQCNMYCTGCYARANHSCDDDAAAVQLSGEQWHDIFRQAQDAGVLFVLLAGGEPLMRRDVLQAAANCDGIIFPVFTNGTLLDDTYLDLFAGSGNLLPVLSIEGDEAQTDGRRGSGTYGHLMELMAALKERDILFGASVTVNRENLDEVSGSKFCQSLNRQGCRVLILVEYIPVSPETRHMALTVQDRSILGANQAQLKRNLQEMIIVSFPGDEKASGGCMAAGRGFFHINPGGGAEPCPFSPFSDTSLLQTGLLDTLRSPFFRRLIDSGMLDGESAGGCRLFNCEDEVRALLAG